MISFRAYSRAAASSDWVSPDGSEVGVGTGVAIVSGVGVGEGLVMSVGVDVGAGIAGAVVVGVGAIGGGD